MDEQKLGRFEVLAEIGRGAMGIVYKAKDPMLERVVAIKTINMGMDRDGAEMYEKRFYQEARAAGGLNHPNIVTVYDIGKTDTECYMAMEYIEGAELRTLLLPGKPLPVARALSIAAQVAEGLAYAHERGVVHRDIKPANIMVPESGAVKITDFGIARMRSSNVQTQTGMMMGSPKYMSPEQVIGKRADHRTDIFSLGVILYEMLTGAAPFTGESVNAVMYQIVNFVPPAPSAINPASPAALDATVAGMLAKSLDERFQSAAEVARGLRDCELQAHGAATAATSTLPLGSLAPGPTRTVVDQDVKSAVLSQTLERSRRAEIEATPPPDAAPARGLSRTFDSLEATQRLVALSDAAQTSDPTANTLPLTMQTTSTALSGGWRPRDTLVVATSAVAGLIVAALIVLL
ncbi:MAG: serine/threonine protein kinase [Betaproteobacteria bacterium]|nr:serine/threonine protein kinase [Betaproteobacteria bacterium]MDH5577740.1 serine/threonine protein kinase [Betaproteobacteria bacterium]